MGDQPTRSERPQQSAKLTDLRSRGIVWVRVSPGVANPVEAANGPAAVVRLYPRTTAAGAARFRDHSMAKKKPAPSGRSNRLVKNDRKQRSSIAATPLVQSDAKPSSIQQLLDFPRANHVAGWASIREIAELFEPLKLSAANLKNWFLMLQLGSNGSQPPMYSKESDWWKMAEMFWRAGDTSDRLRPNKPRLESLWDAVHDAADFQDVAMQAAHESFLHARWLHFWNNRSWSPVLSCAGPTRPPKRLAWFGAEPGWPQGEWFDTGPECVGRVSTSVLRRLNQSVTTIGDYIRLQNTLRSYAPGLLQFAPNPDVWPDEDPPFANIRRSMLTLESELRALVANMPATPRARNELRAGARDSAIEKAMADYPRATEEEIAAVVQGETGPFGPLKCTEADVVNFQLKPPRPLTRDRAAIVVAQRRNPDATPADLTRLVMDRFGQTADPDNKLYNMVKNMKKDHPEWFQ